MNLITLHFLSGWKERYQNEGVALTRTNGVRFGVHSQVVVACRRISLFNDVTGCCVPFALWRQWLLSFERKFVANETLQTVFVIEDLTQVLSACVADVTDRHELTRLPLWRHGVIVGDCATCDVHWCVDDVIVVAWRFHVFLVATADFVFDEKVDFVEREFGLTPAARENIVVLLHCNIKINEI